MSDYFEWLDTYSVGIKQFDDDHKVLISIANEIVKAISQSSGQPVVRQILDELMEYVVYHFDHEESLMEQTGYPDLESHRRKHDRLVRRLVELVIEYRKKDPDPVAVGTFVIDWLLTHTLQEDKKYCAHFQGLGMH